MKEKEKRKGGKEEGRRKKRLHKTRREQHLIGDLLEASGFETFTNLEEESQTDDISNISVSI